jgi:hypothetical protein
MVVNEDDCLDVVDQMRTAIPQEVRPPIKGHRRSSSELNEKPRYSRVKQSAMPERCCSP